MTDGKGSCKVSAGSYSSRKNVPTDAASMSYSTLVGAFENAMFPSNMQQKRLSGVKTAVAHGAGKQASILGIRLCKRQGRKSRWSYSYREFAGSKLGDIEIAKVVSYQGIRKHSKVLVTIAVQQSLTIIQ